MSKNSAAAANDLLKVMSNDDNNVESYTDILCE